MQNVKISMQNTRYGIKKAHKGSAPALTPALLSGQSRDIQARKPCLAFLFYSSLSEISPDEMRRERCWCDILTRMSSLLSDELREEKEKYKAVCDDMDATFAEMTGY